MDHDREPERQPIKIVDRRRFTAEGAVRPDAGPLDEARPRAARTAPSGAADAAQDAARGAAASPARRAATPVPERAPDRRPERADAERADKAERSASSVEFLPFVATLATNAMAALGMLPDAERQGIPRSPQMAREYIDIIAMLEERTRGNLTDEEAQTMTRLLSDLRVQYVELTRSVQPAHVAPPVPPHLR